MKSVKIPYELKKINEIFEKSGFEVYLVGGAVRDMLLGKAVHDWDLTTNATPENVIQIFRKVIPTGIAHGTVTVHFMGKEIEVTTFRCENGYTDGRHPDSVSFNATLEEDLSRRDFTMNAIAASLKDGRIIDPFDGSSDIKRKLIKTVGVAKDRFLEDGLRPIRALRFCSQLDFEIDPEIFSAISDADVQEKIKSISLERFRDEFEKILCSPVPSVALHKMEDTGILKLFIPELAACRGVTQADARGFHEFDVLDHNIYSCDGAPDDNFIVRLSALFHDIGKKDAKTLETVEWPKNSGEYKEIIHFHKHEIYSAEQVVPILTRLKFPNAVINRVANLIKNHMFFFNDNWTDSAVRRFIVRVQADCVSDLIELWKSDMYGMHRTPVIYGSKAAQDILSLQDRVAKIIAEDDALSLHDLAVNGKDLIGLGIAPGKRIGLILEELFQCVLDDPQMNTKENLLEVAKKINESKF